MRACVSVCVCVCVCKGRKRNTERGGKWEREKEEGCLLTTKSKQSANSQTLESKLQVLLKRLQEYEEQTEKLNQNAGSSPALEAVAQTVQVLEKEGEAPEELEELEELDEDDMNNWLQSPKDGGKGEAEEDEDMEMLEEDDIDAWLQGDFPAGEDKEENVDSREKAKMQEADPREHEGLEVKAQVSGDRQGAATVSVDQQTTDSGWQQATPSKPVHESIISRKQRERRQTNRSDSIRSSQTDSEPSSKAVNKPPSLGTFLDSLLDMPTAQVAPADTSESVAPAKHETEESGPDKNEMKGEAEAGEQAAQKEKAKDKKEKAKERKEKDRRSTRKDLLKSAIKKVTRDKVRPAGAERSVSSNKIKPLNLESVEEPSYSVDVKREALSPAALNTFTRLRPRPKSSQLAHKASTVGSRLQRRNTIQTLNKEYKKVHDHR